MDDQTAPLAAIDWDRARSDLDETGAAEIGPVLAPENCAALAAVFDDERHFRARIDMARHGFGRGVYKYFAEPLPEPVAALRQALYPPLARIAADWAARLGDAPPPPSLEALTRACRAAGQDRPTPLLLRYGPGDYNCLHRDLYGAVAFPLQAVVMLSRPEDFAGGAFAVVENRPRLQSRVTVRQPARGHAVVFATARKPRRTARGWSASTLRHGVSEVTAGQRTTLGIIFHDAA
ncbi:2OG-Fe(II) oxygenase [Paralimibaculum aggregatum]|uniref:2OG-Fe(II) oxygenase n=1 Tax=Paralimibaculum aggregatum TaxID=3036245 RepID=A0ABQ6LNG0_9RHOB|nr:2OG-Fe(II) oxygenase [Limibaculum sp. NKW23]GMG84754.1 2OG-Fe(II) oxygenase [Limibaculum sp. NKW23]